MAKIIGILPMAGKGSRIQPIGFSKELYPIIYNRQHHAISEFSINSMLRAGADEIRLVVHPDKLDIAKYYSQKSIYTSVYFYESKSLPESCLYPIKSLADDDICLFGLPDTLFAPASAHKQIVNSIKRKNLDVCLGLFKVVDASKFDSVSFDKNGIVKSVLVKKSPPLSDYIWGIWGARVKALRILQKYIDKQNVEGSEKLLGVGFDSLAKHRKVKLGSTILSDKYYDIGTMETVLHVNDVINRINLDK